MRYLGDGHGPGLYALELTAEERRQRRPRCYRTRRPRWLRPTIIISPDPGRCRFCTAHHFNLLAPDYDPVYDGMPEIPMAMSVCGFEGWCRYREVLCPQPWHDFGPVPTCMGFEPAYSDPHRCIVDLAPGRMRWWPGHLPSEPQRSAPTDEELLAYVGLMLIPRQLRELNRTDPKHACKEALERIKKRTNFHNRVGEPHITITAKEIRIWNIAGKNRDGSPHLVMPLKDFIARAMPPTVIQTRLI